MELAIDLGRCLEELFRVAAAFGHVKVDGIGLLLVEGETGNVFELQTEIATASAPQN